MKPVSLIRGKPEGRKSRNNSSITCSEKRQFQQRDFPINKLESSSSFSYFFKCGHRKTKFRFLHTRMPWILKKPPGSNKVRILRKFPERKEIFFYRIFTLRKRKSLRIDIEKKDIGFLFEFLRRHSFIPVKG